MTEPTFDLDTLRKAFQDRGPSRPETEASADPLSEAPTPDEIWDAVRGEGDEAHRLALVDRATDDPGVAFEWRLARELQREMDLEAAADESSSPEVRAAEASRFGRPAPSSTRWLALAASLVLAVVVAVFFIPWDDDGVVTRNGDAQTIEALTGIDAPLPSEAPTLRWTAVGGARYKVSVLRADDLDEVFRATDLERPQVDLPKFLWSVAAGDELLWRVEALLPSGERVRSETFRLRLASE